METERLSLEGQFGRANEQLFQKNQLIPSLTRNLNLTSDLLAEKVKEKRMLELQSKLAGLKIELATARKHQMKFIEYFGELANLNTTLQGKLNEFPNVLDEKRLDKKKTEELKHKIEVILEPMQAKKEQ